MARVVAPGVPHHVTQRGNRRPQVFFSDDDYEVYKALLAEGCRAAGVEVWAYCLMPNHFHLVVRIRKREVIEELIRNKIEVSTSSKVLNFGKVKIDYSFCFSPFEKALDI